MNENLHACRGRHGIFDPAGVETRVGSRYPWVRGATHGYHPQPLRGQKASCCPMGLLRGHAETTAKRWKKVAGGRAAHPRSSTPHANPTPTGSKKARRIFDPNGFEEARS
ncbi:hypothetical protein SAMN06265222_106314 [Neorhodopirellula lusitana]|uniref:Uncharacterized protein n=1 Tax=Neorhodopirellula lusitana TaxID=445327 RepID=A0ABY1Q9J9_9BACT|nr:hypothetical protein SAMN06265222_106314 [Neorhodopirellula lusitana]